MEHPAKKWTEAEIEYVKTSTERGPALAAKLGRSLHSIHWFCRRNGIDLRARKPKDVQAAKCNCGAECELLDTQVEGETWRWRARCSTGKGIVYHPNGRDTPCRLSMPAYGRTRESAVAAWNRQFKTEAPNDYRSPKCKCGLRLFNGETSCGNCIDNIENYTRSGERAF